MLVPDVSKELFQQVFNRHDSCRSTEFVDHDRQRCAAAEEREEQIAGRLRFGHNRHRPHDACKRIRLMEEVMREDYAYDSIDVLAIDRESCKAGFYESLTGRFQIDLLINSFDFGSRDHGILDTQGSQFEHIGKDF